MKIPYNCQPNLCASVDEMRAVLNSVYLDIDEARKARLITTDGHRIVVIPVEVDTEDVAGFIPAKAFELERANATGPVYSDAGDDDVRNDRAQIFRCLAAEVVLSDGIKVPRPDHKGFNFPDSWQKVSDISDAAGPVVATVALNAELLVGIQRAFGATSLTISVIGPTHAFRIQPHHVFADPTDNRKALLMPVRLESPL